jgi:hypothetical protein
MQRKWWATGATVLTFALTPGAALASDGGGLVQSLTQANTNATTQSADASTTTVNVPVSVLNGNAVDGRGGDTQQSVDNGSSTAAGNANGTQQANGASQSASGAGGTDQSARQSNANSTDQSASASTHTVNAPVSVLNGNAVRGKGGDTDQSIDNHTSTKAGNANGTKQKSGAGQSATSGDRGGDVAQSLRQRNDNTTHQSARSSTRTVNVPVSALNGNAYRGKGGGTDQSIDNHTSTKAGNANRTEQENGAGQTGS